jgi:DNA-binding LacI/PurR family transcriptional regulator
VIVPNRPSLIAGAAESLKKAIESGEISGVLPNVRTLSDNLCVSVPTVVAAVKILARDGYVEARQGRPTRVVFSGDCPEVPPESGHRKIVFVGFGLEILLRSEHYRDVADRLQKLDFDVELTQFTKKTWQQGHEEFGRTISKIKVACWVLVEAPSLVQKWFSDRKLPCLVCSGVADAEVSFPDFEMNFEAVYRHCANQFLNLGHERIHLLIEESCAAKNPKSIDAFVETVQKHLPEASSSDLVKIHDGTPENCEIILQRLFAQKIKPTGLCVVWVNYYILTQSWLQTRGFKIPEDVSLVCRDGDKSIHFLRPTSAHYTIKSSDGIHRQVVRAILAVVERTTGKEHTLVLPEFFHGESLAAAKI